MRILMLGWEFPPFIAGGLGTACHGLTKALDRLGHEIIFVLPKAVPDGVRSHVKLIGPESLSGESLQTRVERVAGKHTPGTPAEVFERTRFIGVPAAFTSPYPQGDPGESIEALLERVEEPGTEGATSADILHQIFLMGGGTLGEIGGGGDSGTYGWDLIGDANRYAQLVVALGLEEEFDVIHAHDWLTYPAGVALRAISGKPLVVHVHATEYDRSGEHINERVAGIERMGIHAADRAIAVSMLTKNICVQRYGADPDRVQVVYNGVDQESAQPERGARIEARDKIVLFLGRITMQKGPEYFINAAKRVLEKEENVKFVVAGSGDMAVRMIEQAAHLGIGHKVLFTGFLRRGDVERVFRMADLYVMPSVSEPFGIAPLEAMQQGTPVLISKQSGVSEVLTHALKVDFWDVDEMANKIIAVLRYPPLQTTLREHGAFEARRLTWDGAAEQCLAAYGVAASRR